MLALRGVQSEHGTAWKRLERRKKLMKLTTNLIYQTPMLKERKWYFSINMDRYIAALIDTLNRGETIQELIKPAGRISEMISLYKKK